MNPYSYDAVPRDVLEAQSRAEIANRVAIEGGMKDPVAVVITTNQDVPYDPSSVRCVERSEVLSALRTLDRDAAAFASCGLETDVLTFVVLNVTVHDVPSPEPDVEGITLTATNSDDEPDRIQRLQRVLRAVRRSGGLRVLERVQSLHDHKGDLTVAWKTTPDPRHPTTEETEHFDRAWEDAEIGDGSDNVEHTC